jgi:eukaryotic-like serine/threonine-protein kinase
MSLEQSTKRDPKTLIGRYQVVTRIGAGGMAAVYKAIHVDLGREVALKVMPPETAVRPLAVERFRKEAQLAAKLRHENIVTLYEVGESCGTHFLAMEYVDGTDLQNYIQQKEKLEPDEARKITMQAAKALVLAHKFGIVHRDIKPSNFLMALRDGRYIIKLTDFGLARIVEEEDHSLTRAGTTIGTVDYISPEQARNSRAADIRSDIYSLGCTLYHMLAGKPPFFEGDLTERLLKHVEAEPEDIRLINPKVPEGLVLVLQRMMAKKPEDRYQTPAELLKDLENPPSSRNLSPREILAALGQQPEARPRSGRPAAGALRKVGLPESTSALDQAAHEEPQPGLRSQRPKLAVSPRRPRDAEEEPSSSDAWMIWIILACVIAIVFCIWVIIMSIRGTPISAAPQSRPAPVIQKGGRESSSPRIFARSASLPQAVSEMTPGALSAEFVAAHPFRLSSSGLS